MHAKLYFCLLFLFLAESQAGYIVSSNVLYRIDDGEETVTTTEFSPGSRKLINVKYNCAGNQIYSPDLQMCLVSGEVLDSVKSGLNVAYEGIHCGFHKLKELVKHHEHDVDPCTGKSTTQSTVEYFGNTENYPTATDGRRQPEVSYGWRV